MANSPIAGLPYPATSDAPAGPSQFQALTTALDSVVVARFATTSLRDSTITSPANGQLVQCLDSGLWEYIAGYGWVTTGVRTAVTRTSAAAITSTGPTGNVSGFDGVTFTTSRRRTYRLAVSVVISGDTAGDSWRLYVQIDSGIKLDVRRPVVATGGPGANYDTWISFPFALASGTHTINAGLTRTSGGGTITLSNAAQLVITDEGPA